MTTTGPMPVLRETSTARMDCLSMMGAPVVTGIWRSYRTADAVIDTDRGVLFVACDPDPDPGDWAQVCGLIAAVGWDNGSRPHSQDPGEPVGCPLGGVCVWRLEYARPCIWCDGRGCSDGCPLCGKTV